MQIHIEIDTVTVLGQLHLFIVAKRHKAVADARIQLILLHGTSNSSCCFYPGLIIPVHLLQVSKGKKLS